MKRSTKLIIVAGTAIAVAGGAATIAAAQGDDPPTSPPTPDASTLDASWDDDDRDDDDRDDVAPADADVDRAATAALEATGGGTVVDAEWDDGGYEIEVRQTDGQEVEVHLDGAFAVQGAVTDDD